MDTRNTVIVMFVTIAIGSLFYYFKRKKIPTKFEENVARITNIFLYPIKSVPGIEVDSASIRTSGGLVYKDIVKDRLALFL